MSKKSGTIIAERITAWRNRIGPPSIVSTRRPSAAFPAVRPRVATSDTIGYPNTITVIPTTTSTMPVVPKPELDETMATINTKTQIAVAMIVQSISVARIRDPIPAVSKSRTTASGVTMLGPVRGSTATRSGASDVRVRMTPER